jgi:Inner membrane protein YgaP-like, transmembrane domain
MTMERALRAIAGSFILLSLLMVYLFDCRWLIFTAFIGLNLLQSAFTNWCPMMWVLRKFGLK